MSAAAVVTRPAWLVPLSVVLLAFVAAVDSTSGPFSFVDVTYTESHTLVFNPSSRTYRYSKNGSVPLKGDVVAVVVDRNPNAPGWDFIRFSADEAYVAQNQSEAFYAVGYAEGFLTADAIYSSFVTAMSDDGLPWMNDMINHTAGQLWLKTHVAFMRNLSYTNTSAYGVMVKSLLRQIDGLYDGYTAAVGPANATRSRDAAQPLSWMDMFLISFQTEIIRAEAAAKVIYANLTNETSGGPKVRRLSDHCSALIRFTGNDVVVGHDTWSSYNTMGSREYKTYSFGTKYSVTMSGYPASLSSIDDWYMTQSKLAVTETSLHSETVDFDDQVRPESLSEFMRAMLANYLAANGPEWAALFSEYNSGTYNNQYMILDAKLAAQKLTDQVFVYKALPPNTFWVVEQAPGLMVGADQTALLNRQKYFASYNIPFYDKIYDRAGYVDAEKVTGSLMNYATDARARLFRRLMTGVTDVASMYRVMRHNDWEHDDESLIFWCVTKQYGPCKQNRTAMFAIASRGDLAPPEGNGGPVQISNYSFAESVTWMNHGATDTKVTSVRNMMGKYNIGYAINGPTSQGQPKFNATAYIALTAGRLIGMNWRGVPAYFDFPPVRFIPEVHNLVGVSFNTSTLFSAWQGTPPIVTTAAPSKRNTGLSTATIVVGVVACAGAIAAASVFVHRKWFSRTRHKLYEGEDTPLV